MNKYEVWAGEELLGVYYAGSQQEAIEECRSDHLYVDGRKVNHLSCGVPASDLLHNMFAREAD